MHDSTFDARRAYEIGKELPHEIRIPFSPSRFRSSDCDRMATTGIGPKPNHHI
jgi:hypothetical protein